MSDQDDLDKDGLEDDLEQDDENTSSDSGSDNSAPPESKDSSDGDKKRFDDLMSKWQTAEARAKKAEKALEAAEAKQKAAASKKGASDRNSAADEFIQFTRESARKQLFEADGRFGKYGLGLDSITGDTLEEMKESAKAHAKLIDSIESRTRNDVLAEHGLEPEVETGSGDDGAKSFAQMSDKEFREFLAERDAKIR